MGAYVSICFVNTFKVFPPLIMLPGASIIKSKHFYKFYLFTTVYKAVFLKGYKLSITERQFINGKCFGPMKKSYCAGHVYIYHFSMD